MNPNCENLLSLDQIDFAQLKAIKVIDFKITKFKLEVREGLRGEKKRER